MRLVDREWLFFLLNESGYLFFLLRPSSVLATFFQALYGEGTPWNSVFTVSLVFSTLSTSSPFNTAEERCLLTPLQIWHERYETAPWRSSCTTCNRSLDPMVLSSQPTVTMFCFPNHRMLLPVCLLWTPFRWKTSLLYMTMGQTPIHWTWGDCCSIASNCIITFK